MPETASIAMPQPWLGPAWRPLAASSLGRRLPRRHLLLLALAAEVLVLGWRNADRYHPPGIPVEQTVAAGHVIT